jgi:ADP-L-glycero-D-manno-heptose 6-epimerase
MIWQLAQQILRGENPKVFEFGDQKRDWIYVEDVVDANLAAAKFNGYGLFLCGGGKATTFNELIALINKYLGTNKRPQYIKNPYEGQFQSHTECDMSKAKTVLGFEPKTTVEEGIRQYMEYLLRSKA